MHKQFINSNVKHVTYQFIALLNSKQITDSYIYNYLKSMHIPYSAIIGWGKMVTKSLSQRIGGEIFGK